MTAATAVLAAASTAAALLVLLAARLDGDRPLGWLGAALSAHGLLVLPVWALPGLGAGAPPAPSVVVGVGLVCAAAVPVVRRPTRTVALLALGAGLLGVVHAVGAATAGTGLPLLRGVETAAVALVLGAAPALARRALARLDAARDTQEEELRLAELRLARTAERDHELRGGLAGLAGAVRMLGRDPEDKEHLNDLVAAELRRLHELLEGPTAVPHEPPRTAYDIEPLLGGLVALRRASGLDLHLAVEPGLRVVGSPATLAQVVTNLVGNAERHATGSPIRIAATRSRGRIAVLVRDLGPGVPRGREEFVFERGVRDQGRGGRGLGLHVCRTLLATEGGTIAVVPNGPQAQGCTVLVDLPAAATAERPTPRPVPAGIPCSAS